MVNSPTETLRKFTLFMRGVAATVALTFSALILAPTAQAVQQYDWSFSSNTAESVETRLSETMLQVKQLLEQLDAKQTAGQEASAELAALEQAKEILENLDEEMTQKLSDTAQNIRDKGLPEVIRQRHQEMMEQYHQEMATLRANLEAIDAADDPQTAHKAVEKAKTHVKSKYQKRPDQVFDEADIRSRGHKPNPDNKPKQRPADYRGAGLFSNPYPQLAALGDFTFDQLPGANDPAYMGETDEIVLTQPIRDKAAELQYDPVKIHHWVRN
ncbi:MAG: hypothetical protein P8103_07000, partial [Candidatus Thiodiazotropha sp.]